MNAAAGEGVVPMTEAEAEVLVPTLAMVAAVRGEGCGCRGAGVLNGNSMEGTG